MPRPRWLLLVLLAVGCSSPAVVETPDSEAIEPLPAGGGSKSPKASATSAGPGDEALPPEDRPLARGASNLRIMAANITSGASSKYDSGEGIRMFRALRPDIALIQELNYKNNTDADLAELVKTAFGEGYNLYREPGMQIPNGIASRFPILESGRWADPNVANRGFAYAKIEVPGTHPLWAVSVHLLTSGASNRNAEAASLVAKLKSVIAPDDYVAIGGDFNTDGRTEQCLSTFKSLLDTGAPYPADQNGNEKTNANRNKPYDWVIVSPTLRAQQVPTTIGAKEFANGLVFDSRVYTPLSDVAPVLRADSQALNMQHMPVIKDFAVSN